MFELYTRTQPDCLILDLVGPIGREGGEAILQVVQEQPALPERLILNFTRVDIISTAGLGGVLWAVRLVARAGHQTFAFGLNSHLRKVFHVMGITQYVAIVEDEASALA